MKNAWTFCFGSTTLRPLSDPGDVQETAARLLGQHLDANRVGYAEFDGAQYAIRREDTRRVPPLAGQRPGISLGKQLNEALGRGETIVITDVQTDPRLSDSDRATLQPRQIAALIGTTLFKRDITPLRAPGRPRKSRWFARSPNGPGTQSSAPAPKRRSASSNSGSASRSKRRPAAPGRGSPRPIRSTGTNDSVRCTASRPINPRLPKRGPSACTRTTVRGCSRCARRSGRRRRRIRSRARSGSYVLTERSRGSRAGDVSTATPTAT